MVLWLGGGGWHRSRDVKEEGNKAFAERDLEKAVALYSEGLAQLVGSTQREKRATLLSNRSAAQASLQNWDEALSDANEAIQLAPAWSKPYARKGKAHFSRREYQQAAIAYAKGCEAAMKSADEAEERHQKELTAIKNQAQTQSEEYQRLLDRVASLESQLADYELVFDKSKNS